MEIEKYYKKVDETNQQLLNKYKEIDKIERENFLIYPHYKTNNYEPNLILATNNSHGQEKNPNSHKNKEQNNVQIKLFSKFLLSYAKEIPTDKNEYEINRNTININYNTILAMKEHLANCDKFIEQMKNNLPNLVYNRYQQVSPTKLPPIRFIENKENIYILTPNNYYNLIDEKNKQLCEKYQTADNLLKILMSKIDLSNEICKLYPDFGIGLDKYPLLSFPKTDKFLFCYNDINLTKDIQVHNYNEARITIDKTDLESVMTSKIAPWDKYINETKEKIIIIDTKINNYKIQQINIIQKIDNHYQTQEKITNFHQQQTRIPFNNIPSASSSSNYNNNSFSKNIGGPLTYSNIQNNTI